MSLLVRLPIGSEIYDNNWLSIVHNDFNIAVIAACTAAKVAYGIPRAPDTRLANDNDSARLATDWRIAETTWAKTAPKKFCTFQVSSFAVTNLPETISRKSPPSALIRVPALSAMSSIRYDNS